VKTVTSVYIHNSEKSCFVQKGRMVPICLHCLNCTKFGQLILRKTIKSVATRDQILRLKCTQFDFGWGSAPDPARGAYSAPPEPLAGFKGPTSKGGGRKKRRGGEGDGGKREGGSLPPSGQLWIRPCPRPPSWNQGALLLRGGEGAEGRSLKIWTPQSQKPSYAPA